MRSTLVDAGPLIALFDGHDRHHARILEILRQTRAGLITTWPVVTETCHMLDFSVDAQLDFLEWAYRGGVHVHELRGTDLERIITLTRGYRDRPMDLADASLLVASETLDVRQIISMDSDFDIYRRADRRPLENLFYR